MEDMQEDLEKYKQELEDLRKQVASTMMNNGNVEELRKKMLNIRMNIALLEDEIEKCNGNEGKTK